MSMRDTTKFTRVAVLLSAALFAISAAQASEDPIVTSSSNESPWVVRLRALYIAPSNNSSAVSIPGALSIPKDGIHVQDKWAPEIDVEYFFLKHWSAELVLTYPQEHDVTVKNATLYPGGTATNVRSAKIGTIKELPPTITVKYNFLPDGDFRPYVGVGINVTSIMDVNLNVPTVGAVNLKHTTVGPAGQAGFDYRFTKHWFANLDVKYFLLQPHLTYNGSKVGTLRIDPLLAGIGIGYRF